MNQRLHISTGVSKLTAKSGVMSVTIPSINLPAVVTCRQDAPCFKQCYARKGRFSFGHTADLLRGNLEIWKTDPKYFESAVSVAAYNCRFFRWHSSGDIPDIEYLKMMVRIANALPGTAFLAFTKKFELVNEYIEKNGMPPENLKIVFSAWGSFLPENPHNLPVAYIKFKKEECSIPDDAIHCSKYCGSCVLSGASCWHLNHGQSVYFDEH